MPGRLEGRSTLITGTARGMGRAAAIRSAAEGARVVGCDLDIHGAQETVKQVSVVVRTALPRPVGVAEVDRAPSARVILLCRDHLGAEVVHEPGL